jgi:glucokinase
MKSDQAKKSCLVSDIGGTNIRMAWFADDPRQRMDEANFRVDPKTGKPYEILTAIREYLARVNVPFSAACFGVAGEVRGDSVKLTNRPDTISRTEIAKVLKLDAGQVLLINDMPPHLACVDFLKPSELIEIRAGEPNTSGSRAVLMPGTGVGVGGAISTGGTAYLHFPSEGGHVDFAPRDIEQDRLMQFLRPIAQQSVGGPVSNELVFAGEGLRRLYAFLRDSSSPNFDGVPKSEEITTAAANGDLPETDLRRRTVELYMRILGAAAGNLALMMAATGGLYLGGSICLSLRRFLMSPHFIDAFLNSGPATHRAFMQAVPIRLINYKDSGLLGAGALAKGLLLSV